MSRNNTELFNTQLQYRLRRIGLLAGYAQVLSGDQRQRSAARNREFVFCWGVAMVQFLLKETAHDIFAKRFHGRQFADAAVVACVGR